MSQPGQVATVMDLILPASTPTDVPDDVRGYFEELSNAILQLRNYIEQYCGITQKDASLWASLPPDTTLLEYQLRRLYVQFGQAMSYGQLVNLISSVDGTTVVAQLADQSASKAAHGICTAQDGVPVNGWGEVIIKGGLINGVNGVTPGQRYWLSTSGQLQPVAPSTGLVQFAGIGITQNSFYMDLQFNY